MRSNNTVQTNHGKIFDYWKDKAILRDGSVMLEEDAVIDHLSDSIPVVYDWGEPVCWACGRVISESAMKAANDWIESNDDTNAPILRMYNIPKIRRCYERAHIVPRQFGGKDVPQNLFLLCKKCHRDSPDTKNASSFFRWVYERRKHSTDQSTDTIDIFRELIARGYGEYDATSVINAVNGVRFNELDQYLSDNVGAHGGMIAESTFFYAKCDYYENLILNSGAKKADTTDVSFGALLPYIEKWFSDWTVSVERLKDKVK